MNPRILKKLCKRASWYLRKLQMVRGKIVRDEDADSFSMPWNMHIAERHIAFRFADSVNMNTLKCTEFCEWRCSYEYDEYDFEPSYFTLLDRYRDAMYDWENFHYDEDAWPPKWLGPARVLPSHVFAWANVEITKKEAALSDFARFREAVLANSSRGGKAGAAA